MKALQIFALIIVLGLGSLFLFLKSKDSSNVETNYKLVSDTTRIKKDITAILNTKRPRNYENLKELNQVADYIKSQFQEISDSVSEHQFIVQDSIYRNIVCSINTDKQERIIIGAHYDVCGDQDGADDNASGVVGMLELARLLKDKDLNYRIDFVAYTLEEPPFFATEQMGSYQHAKYLHDNDIIVKGMISLEMIGYFSDKESSQDYPLSILEWIYGNKGDFITVVQKFQNGEFGNKFSNLMLNQSLIRTIAFQAPASLQGIDYSDHRNYWDFGYSAIMITNSAFYRNKNYHKPTDRIETIDFRRLGLVVDEVYYSLLEYQ